MIPSFENVFVGKTPEGKHQNINCGSLGGVIMILSVFMLFLFFKLSLMKTVSYESKKVMSLMSYN